MLRRRHHPQAEAVGEAEGRKEEDEIDRPGRHPAKGLYGGAGDGGRKIEPCGKQRLFLRICAMVARVKRRWYQFSLRTLFIAFTLVSIVLVACIDLAPAQRQAVAVNRVYALGGDLWLGQRVAKGSWILNQL